MADVGKVVDNGEDVVDAIGKAAIKRANEIDGIAKGVINSSSDSSKIKQVFKSIKDSPNYPSGFQGRLNGTTSNKVNNMELLEQLIMIESGTWKKVYKDGYDELGNKISIHYFQSQLGKVFDVKVKNGWSN